MLLSRCTLAFTLLTACASARADASPPAPPAERPAPRVDDIVATRVQVAYHDVHELAGVLRDLFDVRPDRGDVRVILSDERAATLIVFATPAGIDAVRRVLGPALAPTTASM